MMKIEGNILVQPHILKFVNWLENLESGERLDLSGGGIISHTLVLLLRPKTLTKEVKIKGKLEHFTTTLPYVMSFRLFKNAHATLGRKEVLIFHHHMHKLFHEFLLRQILHYIHSGKTQIEAIKDFLILIDAEEDVDWESVKRVNLRLRNSKKIVSFYPESVGAA